MRKNFIKSVAAVAAAMVMAGQAMAFSASAETYYYYYNGVYYSSATEAANAYGNTYGRYDTVAASRIPSSVNVKYYDTVNKKYYDSYDAARSAGVTSPSKVYVGTYYYDNYYYGYDSYYSSYTGRYYRTYDEALNASKGISSYVTYVGSAYNYNYGYRYNSDYIYYNSKTGHYYKTYSDAAGASNGDTSGIVYVGGYYNNGYYSNYYGYGHYYSSYTNKYYDTYSAALSASNGIASYVHSVGTLYYADRVLDKNSIYKFFYNGVGYPSLEEAKKAGGTVGVDIYYSAVGTTGDTSYYYYYNGNYYGTLSAAKNAGGTELGVDITYVPYNYYGNAHYNYGPYADPYYQVKNGTANTVTTSTKAEYGVPYVYGKSNRAGWSNIKSAINNASKGSNVKVDMNGAKVVDKSILDAIKGKNISVTFVLENGVKWTINGKDVSTAKDLVIDTTYNIDYIPNALVKKAASGSVARAQVGVSNNFDSLGSDVSVTVKFAEKRAGCTATIYAYNPSGNSLKSVYKAKVQSNGTCTFSVDEGGAYLIVLK